VAELWGRTHFQTRNRGNFVLIPLATRIFLESIKKAVPFWTLENLPDKNWSTSVKSGGTIRLCNQSAKTLFNEKSVRAQEEVAMERKRSIDGVVVSGRSLAW